MTHHLLDAVYNRFLAEGGEDSHSDGHSEFGVHITYEDLFESILFLVAIYVSGQIANVLKMPSLVGEIVCGIILGPPLADFVPNAEAWVMFGEVGYVLNRSRPFLVVPTLSSLRQSCSTGD